MCIVFNNFEFYHNLTLLQVTLPMKGISECTFNFCIIVNKKKRHGSEKSTNSDNTWLR